MELLVPKEHLDMTGQKQFALSVCPEVLTAAIEKFPNCPTEVNLNSEIMLKEYYICCRWCSGFLVVFILCHSESMSSES